MHLTRYYNRVRTPSLPDSQDFSAQAKERKQKKKTEEKEKENENAV